MQVQVSSENEEYRIAKLRAKARMSGDFERQEKRIGSPHSGDYRNGPALGRASDEKVRRKRRENPYIPAIPPEGTSVGLKTPGLTWTVEDAVDMGCSQPDEM